MNYDSRSYDQPTIKSVGEARNRSYGFQPRMKSNESAISRASTEWRQEWRFSCVPSLRRSVLWQSDTDSSTVPIQLPLVDYSFIPETWYFKTKTANVDRAQRIKEEACKRVRIMVVEWKYASFSLLSASVSFFSLFYRFRNNLNSTGSFEQSPSSRVLNSFQAQFFLRPLLN